MITKNISKVKIKLCVKSRFGLHGSVVDLKKVLPATTKWVTPEERKAQQEERARQYKLRSLGTPCEVGGELDKMY